MNRVGVEPELLRWARERSGRGAYDLQKRFPQPEAWERGSVLPTFKQLEAFARATYAPIGYLFLREPPVEIRRIRRRRRFDAWRHHPRPRSHCHAAPVRRPRLCVAGADRHRAGSRARVSAACKCAVGPLSSRVQRETPARCHAVGGAEVAG